MNHLVRPGALVAVFSTAFLLTLLTVGFGLSIEKGEETETYMIRVIIGEA